MTICLQTQRMPQAGLAAWQGAHKSASGCMAGGSQYCIWLHGRGLTRAHLAAWQGAHNTASGCMAGGSQECIWLHDWGLIKLWMWLQMLQTE